MERNAPQKRQKLEGDLVLEFGSGNNARSDEDSDADDSSTSLSSLDSENMRSSRVQLHRQRILRTTVQDYNSADDTAEEETTSSSGSEESESESEESSEQEDTENDEEESPTEELTISGPPQTTTRTTAIRSRPQSDLRSRLQNFLPQLQRANAELGDPDFILSNRIDDVSNEAEHYIEMDLGLGILSERESPTEELKIPKPRAEEESDHMSIAEEEITGENEALEEDVLARLKGQQVKRGAKRKVEELG